MKKPLTTALVERIKPGPATFAINDTYCPGLILRVTPPGRKTFSVIYRIAGAGGTSAAGCLTRGPQQRITLGVYPHLPVEKARARAREILAAASEGVDPAKSDDHARLRRAHGVALDDVLRQYVVDHLQHTNVLHKEAVRCMERHVLPRLGARTAVQAITTQRVDELLTELRDEQSVSVAIECRKILSGLLRWCAQKGLITASPLQGLIRRDLVPNKDAGRALADDELRRLWAAMSDPEPFHVLVRLLMLTGCRRSEIGQLTWDELDLDAQEGPRLEVGAARHKSRRGHVAPLSAPAAALLRAVPRWTGPFVLTTTGGARPISGFSKAKARLDRSAGIAPYRLHDLRVTVESGLARLGVGQEVRDLVLGHSRGELQRRYNKHDGLKEKRAALELWAEHVMSVVG